MTNDNADAVEGPVDSIPSVVDMGCGKEIIGVTVVYSRVIPSSIHEETATG